MRESIGSTWLLGLVVAFILIFASFLSLSLNYSKSFKLKNEILSIIEKYEGVQETSINIINNYLTYNSYNTVHTCKTGEYGVSSLNSPELKYVESNDKTRYLYCIKKQKSQSSSANANQFKYEVKLFFNFKLPVIGDLLTFDIKGSTLEMTNPIDDLTWQ